MEEKEAEEEEEEGKVNNNTCRPEEAVLASPGRVEEEPRETFTNGFPPSFAQNLPTQEFMGDFASSLPDSLAITPNTRITRSPQSTPHLFTSQRTEPLSRRSHVLGPTPLIPSPHPSSFPTCFKNWNKYDGKDFGELTIEYEFGGPDPTHEEEVEYYVKPFTLRRPAALPSFAEAGPLNALVLASNEKKKPVSNLPFIAARRPLLRRPQGPPGPRYRISKTPRPLRPFTPAMATRQQDIPIVRRRRHQRYIQRRFSQFEDDHDSAAAKQGSGGFISGRPDTFPQFASIGGFGPMSELTDTGNVDGTFMQEIDFPSVSLRDLNQREPQFSAPEFPQQDDNNNNAFTPSHPPPAHTTSTTTTTTTSTTTTTTPPRTQPHTTAAQAPLNRPPGRPLIKRPIKRPNRGLLPVRGAQFDPTGLPRRHPRFHTQCHNNLHILTLPTPLHYTSPLHPNTTLTSPQHYTYLTPTLHLPHPNTPLTSPHLPHPNTPPTTPQHHTYLTPTPHPPHPNTTPTTPQHHTYHTPTPHLPHPNTTPTTPQHHTYHTPTQHHTYHTTTPYLPHPNTTPTTPQHYTYLTPTPHPNTTPTPPTTPHLPHPQFSDYITCKVLKETG
ncbi:hypothetical protein Pcinc_036442 [Petrolisthes cinctipes]|uniref:Uncharacterized protein n=1 Tax=Petrolisthes cinctipes TaxID=88211 RepID=A0AAE1BUD2_PETCI|nr:hypothetical protein Pcinc_036442 [Petrolisthes cinctipes]